MPVVKVLCLILPSLISCFVDYLGLGALTPVLPFYLRDSCGIDDEAEVARWTGIITSVQFLGVCVAALGMGPLADCIGAKRAVQLCLVGNVLFFGSSAWAKDPTTLLCLRLGSGLSSPLVPALAYIFERVTQAEAVIGMSAYAVAVFSGLSSGGAFVVLYEPIGWMGISFALAGLSAGGLVSTLWMVSRPRHDGPRPHPQGVGAALRSGHFVSHVGVAFAIGFSFTSVLSLLPVALHDRGWSSTEVGSVMFGVNGPLIGTPLLLPSLVRRFGTQPTLTAGLSGQLLITAVLTVPAVSSNSAAMLCLSVVILVAMVGAQPPNNARAKAIGMHLTTGGTGTITGLGRFVFSLGCAVGPYVSLSLFTLSASGWVAWLAIACVNAASLLLYVPCGVSLLKDVEWPAQQPTVRRPAVDLPSTESTSNRRWSWIHP